MDFNNELEKIAPGQSAKIVELFERDGWKPSSKDIRKHELTPYMIKLLKVALEYVRDTDTNEFKKGDIAAGLNAYGAAAYGNFPHLRYFALIANIKDEDGKKMRKWLITRQGGAFLRGEYKVPAWVKIKDNHIVERSEQLVGIDDLGLSRVPQTEFEYFDRATGAPQGVRPIVPVEPGEQQAMFETPKDKPSWH